jgi:hypothetical protein
LPVFNLGAYWRRRPVKQRPTYQNRELGRGLRLKKHAI